MIWNKSKVRFIESKRLNDEELLAAFRVPDTQSWWRGVLQIIGDLKDESNQAAYNTVANHGMCASSCGAAEVLQILTERLIALRGEALRKEKTA